jgi:hypothetical protein
MMRGRCCYSLLLLGLLLPCGAPPAAAQQVDWSAEYERLLEWRYAASPVPVPAGGLTIERDSATWTLRSGELRWAEPTSGAAGSAVTGLVFEGEGSFRMTVPDPVEREQLRRFTRGAPSDEFEELTVAFSKLLVRAPRGLEELASTVGGAGRASRGPYERSGRAAERQGFWLEHERFDADVRVIGGLLIPGDDYFTAIFETGDHGWLTYEYEPWNQEEIELRHLQRGFPESWVALDRAEDRRPDGRPGRNRRDVIRIRHVDVRGDFTEPGKHGRAGVTRTHPRLGKLSVDLAVEALVSGPRALRLRLHPLAEVAAVRVDGREAPFLRHHIGGRALSIDSDLYDPDLLVILPGPLAAGAEHTVTVGYELEVLNYLSGRFWYPDEANSYLEDRHTGSFEITLPERIELRAMGRREGEPVTSGRTRTERWVVERPALMLSATFAERPAEYVLPAEGRPTIEVFGPGMGEQSFRSVAEDVSAAVAYFEDLFDLPLDTDRLVVSSITAGHGQAFDGFLHLSEGSFHVERGGATELFRAHETAHEWWAHRVTMESYRDQLLSEAFAEYSAMMFVESQVEDGAELFDQILFAYGEALQGSIKAGFSRFKRTGVVPLNPNLRAEMGPIAVGYRANTADARGAYIGQVYMRGPWVLHMLRVILRDRSGSDDLFVRVLSEFVREHDGSTVTTDDFLASLTRSVPSDWQWFFDQWIYGTAIPTYAWSWSAEPGEAGGDGGGRVAVSVRQEDVPGGFRMPVPVAIDLEDGTSHREVVWVDEPEETFRLPVPGPVRRVTFNPDHAVLASVKRR